MNEAGLWCCLCLHGGRSRCTRVKTRPAACITIACPLSQTCRVHALNCALSPKPAEYIEVMKDKELVLRTDVFEVLLQQLEAQQGAAAAAGGDQPAAAGGADASG